MDSKVIRIGIAVVLFGVSAFFSNRNKNNEVSTGSTTPGTA